MKKRMKILLTVYREVEKDVYIQVISNMLMRAKQRKDEIF